MVLHKRLRMKVLELHNIGIFSHVPKRDKCTKVLLEDYVESNDTSMEQMS